MIPKQAVDKAIEGGWTLKAGRLDNHRPEKENYLDEENQTFHHKGIQIDARLIVLDPSFWQALGKALGWKSNHSRYDKCPYCSEIPWKEHAKAFFNLLLTNSDTTPFWEEILKEKV